MYEFILGDEEARERSGYDVDDRASLNRLCADLLDDRTPANVAAHTRKFLADLVATKGGQQIFTAQ